MERKFHILDLLDPCLVQITAEQCDPVICGFSRSHIAGENTLRHDPVDGCSDSLIIFALQRNYSIADVNELLFEKGFSLLH